MPDQIWNSSQYARDGRFVAELAESLVALLDPRPSEKILDLGCGDGFLTEQIARSGAAVVGMDRSGAMVAAARQRGLDARVGNAEALRFGEEFDAVFSNAALHWVDDQQAALAGVGRALKPGGRFVAELGGSGNIAAIRTALLAVFTRRGVPVDRIELNHFFSPEQYRPLLERAGFSVRSIELRCRPTPLPAGMEAWLATFRRGLLEELPPEDRLAAMTEVLSLLRRVLCDSQGNWNADYVRLRFVAVKGRI